MTRCRGLVSTASNTTVSETLGQGARLVLAPRRQCDVGMTGVLPGGGPFGFAMTNDVDTMHEFTHRTSCLER